MNGIAKMSRFGYLLLGVPLSVFGFIALLDGLTSEGLESWSSTAAAAMLLLVGCMFMMTGFLAHLVVKSEE